MEHVCQIFSHQNEMGNLWECCYWLMLTASVSCLCSTKMWSCLSISRVLPSCPPQLATVTGILPTQAARGTHHKLRMTGWIRACFRGKEAAAVTIANIMPNLTDRRQVIMWFFDFAGARSKLWKVPLPRKMKFRFDKNYKNLKSIHPAWRASMHIWASMHDKSDAITTPCQTE